MSMRPIEVEDTDELDLIEDVARELEERRRERSEEGPREVAEARVGKALEEAKLLDEGVCFEGRVLRIELGRFGDFVPPPRDERFRES